MSLKADDVLRLIAEHPHVMGTLDSGTCAIEHVSERNADGADKRLDACPCDRKFAKGDLAAMGEAERKLLELGEGQYISSPRHTLGDLVRDVALRT